MKLKQSFVLPLIIVMLIATLGVVNGYSSAKVIEIPVRADGKFHSFDILMEFQNTKNYADMEVYADYIMRDFLKDLLIDFSHGSKKSIEMHTDIRGEKVEETLALFSSTFGKVKGVNVGEIYKYGDKQKIYAQVENSSNDLVSAAFEFKLKEGEWKYVLPDSSDGIRFVLALSELAYASAQSSLFVKKGYWSNLKQLFIKNECKNWLNLFDSGYPVKICMPVNLLDDPGTEKYLRSIVGENYSIKYEIFAYASVENNHMLIISDDGTDMYYPVFLVSTSDGFKRFRSRQLELFFTPVLLKSYIEKLNVS